MALLSSTPRARGRRRVDPLPSNVHFPIPRYCVRLIMIQARGNRSPTRSQRKEDRIPKKHYNIFDQTLLPEEDFSGGKLLRKRKTSGNSDSPSRKKRKTSSSTSLVVPPQSSNLDQIEVTSRPRIPPHRPVSQPITALQRITTPPPARPSSSQIATTTPREFRVRDKSVNYTIPSLKSLLPTPPHKRRSPAPHIIQVPKIRTLQPQPRPSLSSPKPLGRPKLRTIIQRNGEKMLLIKLRIASNKLAPLLHKPRIRIVENIPGRKRRIRENEEPEVIEPKREPEKPFGGILTKEDADTSKTTPTDIDRARFERARETPLVVHSYSLY